MAASDKSREGRNTIRMQKLRRAVERLRNIRAHPREPTTRRKSWLARLKARLGLGGGEGEGQSDASA